MIKLYLRLWKSRPVGERLDLISSLDAVQTREAEVQELRECVVVTGIPESCFGLIVLNRLKRAPTPQGTQGVLTRGRP